VPTRLDCVVFDAADHISLGHWWSEALGWPVAEEDDEELGIAAPEGEGLWGLVFGTSADPKVGKNRVHLDLASSSARDQAATVDRLLAGGARRVDVGQGDVPWVVLADPEGNELCVLEPRERHAGAGALAAIVVDAADPAGLAPFWAAAAGWPVDEREDEVVSMRRPGAPPPDLDLVLVPVTDRKVGKNRVHLDVAPHPGDDHAAEVERLVALGARHVDIGQGPDVPWVVLADPEGNELCVLTPR
jgi:predicted enzyme related to lactoylglutathione lyase